jgi:DNA-binding IclR family transcriptional regulator
MPPISEVKESGFVRDLDILEALSEAIARTGEGLRLTDIATVTGREKSQVSRALSRLERAGLVARDDTSRRFGLGWRLFHFAAMTAEARLTGRAQPVMRELVASLGETVHLCVLRGVACVTVHSEIPRHGFRGLAWVGVEAPAHTMTAGRVLLAELGQDSLRALYPDEELPDVPATGHIRTRTELLEECARIRTRGYATVDEEFEPGLVGASSAVYDFRGIAVASLNVAAPKSRLEGKLDALGQRLAGVARRLSGDLGWRA